MDHIDQAVYDTVHNSEVPAKEIASRLGMSHQVLINKANPQSETHKLSLREAVAIQLITGNTRMHSAMGTEIGMGKPPGKKEGLLKTILSASKEHGDVVRAVNEAIEDGRFTLREGERCQQEIDEAIKALTNLGKVIVDLAKDKQDSKLKAV